MKSELMSGCERSVLARPSNGAAPAGGKADLPRERLDRCGAEALKEHELLAIVLGTGYRGCGVLEVARSVLDAHPKEDLMTMDARQLGRLKGLESQTRIPVGIRDGG